MGGRHRKLLERLALIPADFEWSELQALLSSLGFKERKKSGSARCFFHPDDPGRLLIQLHQPHGRSPATVLKPYLRQVKASLEEWGFYE